MTSAGLLLLFSQILGSLHWTLEQIGIIYWQSLNPFFKALGRDPLACHYSPPSLLIWNYTKGQASKPDQSILGSGVQTFIFELGREMRFIVNFFISSVYIIYRSLTWWKCRQCYNSSKVELEQFYEADVLIESTTGLLRSTVGSSLSTTPSWNQLLRVFHLPSEYLLHSQPPFFLLTIQKPVLSHG